ncbi:MAG: DUF6132 family protein [Candidatus Kapabacteria bacterium]|nr:DUF6132 family protein [Candidatus Kapabacteria bacterium]
MRNLVFKYKSKIIFGIIGTSLGWAYWYFVGCASGHCAITSSPVNSSIYGLIMGVLVSDIFKTNKKQD